MSICQIQLLFLRVICLNYQFYAPGNYRFVVDCEKNGIWTEEAEIEFIIGDTTEIIGSGSCGDNAAWTLTRGGMLTITGTGAIQGYFISPSGLRSIVRNVSISDGITSIGDGAFTVCKNMESINIPEGATEIGDSAFYLCEKLKHIDFPSSLKKIGSDAFIFCHALDSIGLPVNVEIITYIRCYEGSLRCISLPSTLEGASAAWVGNR